MSVEILNNSLNAPIWNISFISIFCLSCVIFFGLKLKWFRAQLRLGDDSTRKDTTSVQGVGFRMKTNPEDFQSYKSISEFTPILTQNETKTTQNGQTSSQNNNKTSNIISIKEKSANTNVATINKIYSRPITQNLETTNKPVSKKRTVNFDPLPPVEIPTDLLTEESSDNPNNILKINDENDKKENEYFMRQETPDYPKNIPALSIRNPMATQSFLNVEKIGDEKQENYFMGNNYSSAASIFFGGNVEPVQPKPRKFLQDEDSDGSETCA